MAQAGVTGTWCRVIDKFPIFTDPDEQKIGTAVEFISGKMTFVVESCWNNTHFREECTARAIYQLDKIWLSVVSPALCGNVRNIHTIRIRHYSDGSALRTIDNTKRHGDIWQSLSVLSNSNLFWTLCTALFARSPLVWLVIQIYSEHRATSPDPPGPLAHWNYSKKIFPINWGIPTFVNADLFIIIGIRTYCQRERSSTDWN